MLSDLWNRIYFWSDYGEICSDLPKDICEQVASMENINMDEAKKKVETELGKVNRIVVEAGRDMSEEDWQETAGYAKKLFGQEAVLDIAIRKGLLGGARVAIGGNFVENTVVSRYKKWSGYE